MALGTAPRAGDYVLVWKGPAATIRMAPGAHVAYLQAIDGKDELSLRRKAHLKRYFDAFCEHQDYYKRLNPQQFRREDSLKDGLGSEVAVWAFKAPKWRLYGAILPNVLGKRCFVGTRVDASKKQDEANQVMLKATAKDIGELAEYRQKR